MKVALALLVIAGCAESATRVHLVVHGDLASIDSYDLAIGDRMKTTSAFSDFELMLPDDMAGKEQEIDVAGLSAGDQVAFGSAKVTPQLHAQTSLDVTLTAVQCTTSCEVGKAMCAGNGTMICTRMPNGCPTWSAITACPSAMPYCVNGACTATATGTCGGTATACSMLGDSTSCGEQQGCAWTTPSCHGMATDCDTIDPNVCSIRPQCYWDFNLTHCYPDPAWCMQSTQAKCLDNGCMWIGGCAGTASACSSFSAQSCSQQRGCTVM